VICFIRNTVTGDVKIGCAKDPEKTRKSLQKQTSDRLELLGAIQGEKGDRWRLHNQFHQHRKQGEWFGKEVLPHVQQLIEQERRNPQQPNQTLILLADRDFRDDGKVVRALGELDAKMPICCVMITEGSDLIRVIQSWTAPNRVGVDYRQVRWGRYKAGAMTQAYIKMLRSRCDHKTLLVFPASPPSPTVQAVIKRAEKMKVPVETR